MLAGVLARCCIVSGVHRASPFLVGASSSFVATSSGELYVGVNDNNYSDNTGSWTATIKGGSINAVDIAFNGNTVTAMTVPVLAGQEVPLAALSPDGGTIENPHWYVEGTPVGGFVIAPSYVTPTTGSTIPVDLTNLTTTVFWTKNGSYLVGFTGILNEQEVFSQATFTVTAPMAPTVTTTQGIVNINVHDPSCGSPALQFGGTQTSPGVRFDASVATRTGSYQWVQLLAGEQLNGYSSGALIKQFSIANPELDTGYPYGTLDPIHPAPEDDSPCVELTRLPPDWTEVTMNESFVMYLLWNPMLPTHCVLPTKTSGGTCTSISIPLGYIEWGWSGGAQYDSPTRTWSLLAASAATRVGAFQPSSVFPTWKALAQ